MHACYTKVCYGVLNWECYGISLKVHFATIHPPTAVTARTKYIHAHQTWCRKLKIQVCSIQSVSGNRVQLRIGCCIGLWAVYEPTTLKPGSSKGINTNCPIIPYMLATCEIMVAFGRKNRIKLQQFFWTSKLQTCSSFSSTKVEQRPEPWARDTPSAPSWFRESGHRGRTDAVTTICDVSTISFCPLHPPGSTHTLSMHKAGGPGSIWSTPHVKTHMPHVIQHLEQSLFLRSTQVYLW